MSSACARWATVCILVMGLSAGCAAPVEPGRTETEQSQGQSAREKGIREAKAAIAGGELKLKEYPPLPSPPGHGEYVALLREKCGVDYEVLSTPEFSEALKQEVWAWNETMNAEIHRRFGPQILQQLQDEAHQRWQESLSPKSTE